MRDYVFLFKDNSEDRDCCAYISIDDLKTAHRGIDRKFNIHGACYSKSLKEVNFDDVKTILTEPEFNTLCNYNGEDLTEIINKLLSQEALEFFEEIQKEEMEYLKEEYSFDDDDIEYIFGNYSLDYRDRGVVGCVYKDAYDCGYDEAWSLGYVSNNDSILQRYFNFEEFGENIGNDEYHCTLDDGRIVCLCY